MKTKQGDEPLAALSLQKKVWAQRYGKTFDLDAQNAIHALDVAFHMEPDPPCQRVKDTSFAQHWGDFQKYVTTNFIKSWPARDGTFFRRLADAMETYNKSPDPAAWAWSQIGGEIYYRKMRNWPMPTISEMHAIVNKSGVSVDEKTIRRAFLFYKATPAPSKRGIPPGTKRKSVHRAHR